jgi:hypothetical protein
MRFRRLTTPLYRSSPALLFQADDTAACLSHGRDVLQRLLVRLLPARFLDRHGRRLTPTPLCPSAPACRRVATVFSQHELFALPVSAEQGATLGRVVDLPQPLTRLPREKPLPTARPLTRWERFAQEKGIKKRQKRSSRVWDEASQSWKRRFGRDRVAASADGGAAGDTPVVDAKPWETTGVDDPFSVRAQEKKSRVAAQQGRQANNLAAATKAGVRHVPGLARVNLPGQRGALGDGDRVKSVKRAASLARVSTASMGASPFSHPPLSPRKHTAGAARCVPTACAPVSYEAPRHVYGTSEHNSETNAGQRPDEWAFCPRIASYSKRRLQAFGPPVGLVCVRALHMFGLRRFLCPGDLCADGALIFGTDPAADTTHTSEAPFSVVTLAPLSTQASLTSPFRAKTKCAWACQGKSKRHRSFRDRARETS